MQSHELIREVLQRSGTKRVASDLKLSLSSVYKWGEPVRDDLSSGSTNPLDRIEALVKSTQDTRLVQWVCERAGGFFIQNPKAKWPHPYSAIPAANAIVQEFADLLAVVASATGDNHITPKEAQAIRSRWEELKCATEGFVQGCESGQFKPGAGGETAKHDSQSSPSKRTQKAV